MEYKIEKKVPMPEKSTGKTKVLRDMKVGDSFEFDSSERTTFSSLSSSISRKEKIKFAIRSTSNNKCRIWRTA